MSFSKPSIAFFKIINLEYLKLIIGTTVDALILLFGLKESL